MRRDEQHARHISGATIVGHEETRAGVLAWGMPIDVMAAIGDMITFNGGRPLSCHA